MYSAFTDWAPAKYHALRVAEGFNPAPIVAGINPSKARCPTGQALGEWADTEPSIRLLDRAA
jgi:hypothetical protein